MYAAIGNCNKISVIKQEVFQKALKLERTNAERSKQHIKLKEIYCQ